MKNLAKKVYSKLPFKKQVFSLAKRIVVPSERVFRHLHFTGDFRVHVGRGRSFRIHHYGYEIENTLFWKGIDGGWESLALTIWATLCERSNIIFDVGANTGVYSLIAKAVNPHAKVCALEPVARVYEKLVANCRLNGYDVVCLEVAASDENGTATVYDASGDNPYSSTFHRDIFSDAEMVPSEVVVKRLATVLDEVGLNSIDLMKIDVEGHEPEVLSGLDDRLETVRPIMLIEVLTDEIGRRVVGILNDKAYRFFYIDERENKLVETEVTRRESYNYLACPGELVAGLSFPNLTLEN